MISAAFIWQPGDYDADFLTLNQRIEDAARAIPGFLGVESWVSEDGLRHNATYYWDSMDSLRQLMTQSDHLVAKREVGRWYRGYRVVVAEVLRSYGSEGFGHLTEGAAPLPRA